MTREKAFELITKLLATASDKGASENEAMTAALRAQELMAKYDIEVTDIEGQEKNEEIVEVGFDAGTGNKWKYALAGIIAKNFCCRVYTQDKRFVIFYGYKHNADIACQVFRFLYECGNKFANRYYMNARNHGEGTVGIKNTFLAGYVKGIREVLEKQCRALMLVVPQEVEKSYDEMKKNLNMRPVKSNLRYNGVETKAYNEGVSKGRDTASARYLEG